MDVMLPIHTVNELNGSHRHWSQVSRRRKGIRDNARLCVMQRGRPAMPAVVTMTRLSAGTLDDDGLRAALKSVRDGIADAYGVADNHPDLQWRYAQARCPQRQYGVRIQIAAADDSTGARRGGEHHG